MKIGIVGGTFNPVHQGHLMLGEYAYEQLGLDEVWFLPNGNPPHKTDEHIRVLTEDRLHMLELAIKNVPYFKVEPYELNNDKVSYSYATMQKLKESHPEDEFFFIIGTDSLFELDTWKNPDILVKYCTLLVASRDFKNMSDIQQQILYTNKKYETSVLLLRMPILEVSSSEIRERVEQNLSIKYLVPDTVNQYINSNHLYNKEKYYAN